MLVISSTVSRSTLLAERVRFIQNLTAFALGLLFAASAAQAAIITVNNNGNGTGTASNCDPGNTNTCTLRDAIAKAVGGDTVNFSFVAPNTTIVLTGALPFSSTANSNPIVVDGRGAITLDGNNATRIVVNNVGTVTVLRGLKLVRGNSINSVGGGVRNDGTLTLTECTLSNNVTATSSRGGGVFNDTGATLWVQQSTLSDNSSADGSGVYNETGASLTVTQSTFHNNRSSSTSGRGGGIFNRGSLEVVRSTFSNNSAQDGGGIASHGGTLSVRHTSFIGNQAFVFRGGAIVVGSGLGGETGIVQRSLFTGNEALMSFGGAIAKRSGTLNADRNLYWLNPDSAGGPQGGNCNNCDSNTNPVIADPLLGPLQNNGGSTNTLLPGAGSAAIDAVPCDPQETIDQRGLTRPQGAQCDVGSVEVQQCSLDLIGDASVRGTADATLALRLMLGIAGPTAVSGLDPTSTWTNVEPRWNACQPGPTRLGCTFDLDGNGSVDPAIDGLLLARIAMGFKDIAALNGITFPNGAPRSDWQSISGYLQNTCWMTLP